MNPQNQNIKQKATRLVELLTKINKELETIEATLKKLSTISVNNNNIALANDANKKLERLQSLRTKVLKAQFELTYRFQD